MRRSWLVLREITRCCLWLSCGRPDPDIEGIPARAISMSTFTLEGRPRENLHKDSNSTGVLDNEVSTREIQLSGDSRLQFLAANHTKSRTLLRQWRETSSCAAEKRLSR